MLLVSSLGACSLLFEPNAIDGGALTKCLLVPSIGAFEVDELPCEATEVQLPDISTEPGDESCPVTDLRWTLRRSVDDVVTNVFSYRGAPSDKLVPDAHAIAGRFGSPLFNLTSYHGPTVGRFEVMVKGEGPEQLYQRVAPISDSSYRMRLTMASDTGEGLRVRMFPDVDITPNLGLDVCPGAPQEALCVTPTAFTTFFETFDTGANEELPRFQIRGLKRETYYIDEASVIRLSDDDEIISENLFPTVPAPSAWKFFCSGECTYSVIPIPPAMTEYGIYTLSVTAINAGNVESEPFSVTLNHRSCTEPAS